MIGRSALLPLVLALAGPHRANAADTGQLVGQLVGANARNFTVEQVFDFKSLTLNWGDTPTDNPVPPRLDVPSPVPN